MELAIKKLLFSAILIAFPLFSVFAQANYFPTTLGNKWQVVMDNHDYDWGTYLYELQEPEIIYVEHLDGLVYCTFSDGPFYSMTYDSSTGILYRGYLDNYLWIDFNLPAGTTFIQDRSYRGDPYPTTQLAHIIEEDVVFNGKTYHCKGFYSDNEFDMYDKALYAEDIGLVYYYEHTHLIYYCYLTYQTIGGKLYNSDQKCNFITTNDNICLENPLPEVIHLPINSFERQIQINSDFNRYRSTYWGESILDYIESATLELVYQKNGQSINPDTINLYNNPDNFIWDLSFNLDETLFYNEWTAAYRLKVKNKSIFPQIKFLPPEGYYYIRLQRPDPKNCFFPLHEGNTWQTIFHAESGQKGSCQYKLKNIYVGHDTLINNKKYYPIYNEEMQLWRYDTSLQRLYTIREGREELFMDFDLNGGEVFKQAPHGLQGFRDVTVLTDEISVNGEILECKGYKYSVQDMIIKEFYSRNRGFVKYYSFSPSAPNDFTSEIPFESRIFVDTGFVYHRNEQPPEVTGFDPPEFLSTGSFSDTLLVQSAGNRKCAGLSDTSIINYISEIKLESYYFKDSDTIPLSTISMTNIEGSFDWAFSRGLDSAYFQNEYDLCYRFKITEKSIVPQNTYYPETGYFVLKYKPQTVGIESDGCITQFRLDQNFPNPFNPSTTISFSIAQKAFVELEVFDILGKSVVCLISKRLAPGNYSTVFNAGELSSGIYMVKFSAIDNNKSIFSDTKKMIFLK